MEIAFFCGFGTSPASFRKFDARNAIILQLKGFCRKLKVTTLAKPFIKVNARPIFALSKTIKPPSLSKMKELNKNIIGKGLFTAVKGHLCLTKWH